MSIRVLVADRPSPTRDALVRLLGSDAGFRLAGVASDGEQAVAMVARMRPQVVVMGVQLAPPDAADSVRRIMAEAPTPIVVLVSRGDEQGRPAAKALQDGALAVAAMPAPGLDEWQAGLELQQVLNTVRLMADVRVIRRPAAGHQNRYAAARVSADEPRTAHVSLPQAIALAASTGGPQALQTVLRGLGGDLGVPVLIVQHMSGNFLGGLVSWLAGSCPQPVRLAATGDRPVAGTVYFAPEGHHLHVTHRRTLALEDGPLERGFRPSADVLLRSVAEVYRSEAIGVILTGMGDDGARGLAALRAAGARTFAQDEASSAVYGMPAAAVSIGAAERVLPLTSVGPALRVLLQLKPAATAADSHASTTR